MQSRIGCYLTHFQFRNLMTPIIHISRSQGTSEDSLINIMSVAMFSWLIAYYMMFGVVIRLVPMSFHINWITEMHQLINYPSFVMALSPIVCGTDQATEKTDDPPRYFNLMAEFDGRIKCSEINRVRPVQSTEIFSNVCTETGNTFYFTFSVVKYVVRFAFRIQSSVSLLVASANDSAGVECSEIVATFRSSLAIAEHK